MATNKWHCEACGFTGPTAEFGEQGSRLCPKCHNEDVFEHRIFKCTRCGYQAEQLEFFTQPDDAGSRGEPLPSFIDPIAENVPYFCRQDYEVPSGRDKGNIVDGRGTKYIQVE